MLSERSQSQNALYSFILKRTNYTAKNQVAEARNRGGRGRRVGSDIERQNEDSMVLELLSI